MRDFLVVTVIVCENCTAKASVVVIHIVVTQSYSLVYVLWVYTVLSVGVGVYCGVEWVYTEKRKKKKYTICTVGVYCLYSR